MMEIENFKEKLELEKITEEAILSEPHNINCYKMRIEVYLNGYDTGKGTYLSIYLQLMKGDFDDFLNWPFTKSVILTVMHPENRLLNCEGILRNSDSDDEVLTSSESYDDDSNDDSDDDKDDPVQLWKPDNNFFQRCGYDEFISHEKLDSEGYIKEDRLFIKCQVIQ